MSLYEQCFRGDSCCPCGTAFSPSSALLLVKRNSSWRSFTFRARVAIMNTQATKAGCFICLTPYWHRNLHDDKTLDKMKALSAYEMDMLPRLWRTVMFKNKYFCEHVCHSWLSKSQRAMMINTTGHYIPEPMDFELVQKEGLRLWEMLEGLIDGMANRVQIQDCKDFLLVFSRMSLGKKQRVTWRPSGGKKISGTWFGLAESLIEQFCAHLDLEDVHEREMRVIVWKHFILALVQYLIEFSSGTSRTFALKRKSLPAMLESNHV